MNKEIKEITITYTIKLATYTPKAFVEARERLYDLFDEVHYRSTEDIVGAGILTKTTELRIEGEE